MSFPTRLLGPGEEIYLDSKPNWSYLFWPAVFTAVIIAGCIAVEVLWTSAPSLMAWVLLGLGVIALVYFGARYIGWLTKSFVVTSQRIVYRTGVLRRTGREIPIGRVQDVTYHQTIVERIVRAGSLTVESAGRQGQDPFPDISRPDEVQSLINRVVAQSAGGYASQRRVEPPSAPVARFEMHEVDTPLPVTDPTPRIVVAPVPPASPRSEAAPSIAQQLGELAELHQHGVITDAEYEQKRRELLDRL